VRRLGERVDRAVFDRLGRIGNDEPFVQIEREAEAAAARAGADRIVERKEVGLRQPVLEAARHAGELALERAEVGVGLAGHVGEGDPPASDGERLVDRVEEPRARVGALGLLDSKSVDDDVDLSLRGVELRRRLFVVEVDQKRTRLRAHVEPAESLLAENRGERVSGRLLGRFGGGGSASRFSRFFLGRRLAARQERREHERLAPRQPGGRPVQDGLGVELSNLRAAGHAARPADLREKHAQVVDDLRLRADRASRVDDVVLLLERDGGRDVLDRVEIRLRHFLEELARVGRKGLDIAPLPFRVERVEDERAFSAARQARHDGDPLGGEFHRDVLQIVLPDADQANRPGAWGLHECLKLRQNGVGKFRHHTSLRAREIKGLVRSRRLCPVAPTLLKGTRRSRGPP
jgi:hypothetical protein